MFGSRCWIYKQYIKFKIKHNTQIALFIIMMTKECKFVAAQKLYSLYNCVSADAVACQLTVQPNGTVFRRSLGDNIIFTCSLDLPAGSVIVNIQWLNSQKVEILDKSPGRDKYNSILSYGNKSAIEVLQAEVECCLCVLSLSHCF